MGERRAGGGTAIGSGHRNSLRCSIQTTQKQIEKWKKKTCFGKLVFPVSIPTKIYYVVKLGAV